MCYRMDHMVEEENVVNIYLWLRPYVLSMEWAQAYIEMKMRLPKGHGTISDRDSELSRGVKKCIISINVSKVPVLLQCQFQITRYERQSWK